GDGSTFGDGETTSGIASETGCAVSSLLSIFRGSFLPPWLRSNHVIKGFSNRDKIALYHPGNPLSKLFYVSTTARFPGQLPRSRTRRTFVLLLFKKRVNSSSFAHFCR